MKISGIHHITAISSDAQKNIDFYSGLLGLRLVKVTVNFDDPSSYHLYYGDELGRPGTALTFFVWPGAERGVIGAPQVVTTSFAAPHGSLPFWKARLESAGVKIDQGTSYQNAINENLGALMFEDFDGILLEIREGNTNTEFSPFAGTSNSEIDEKHAIVGFAGATLSARYPSRTQELLTEVMGLTGTAELLKFSEDLSKGFIALDSDVFTPGRLGAGIVHHIAFRVADHAAQIAWQEKLIGLGYQVSPVMERHYFQSIYFREKGGILFEFATDLPGFTADESAEELGTSLKLPSWMEERRAHITKTLPKITVSGGATLP